MIKYVLSLLLLVQSSYAFLSIENNYQEQAKVLRSLDIDPTFMTDLVFVKMKEDAGKYKTKHFLRVLANGNRFIPVLRNMISEAGIPEAFLYLAMAESNFNASAYSKARAVGIWQFMPYTGKRYGLSINRYVDERRDPIKSTEAAIKYLKYLHGMFGKWYLAAIAYNCGEGRVGKAIKRAGTDDLAVLLDKRKAYVPKESRIYIRKIIMMENIATNKDVMVEENSEYLLNRGNTKTFSRADVRGGTSLNNVADSINMSFKELKSYNPHLKYGFVPPLKGHYHIYIPYGKQTLFESKFNPKNDHSRYFVHVVKKGDSLYSIGKRYGVSYKVIKDYNRLRTTVLRLKKKLVIPVLKPKTRNYKIKKGDTLGKLSRKFNVSINNIILLNKKRNTMVVVGEKIVIPYIY